MKTILVVEDEGAIAEMVASILMEIGYQVAIVGNGQEALKKLETTHADLILSDIMMPIMDGRTLCKRLQEHPVHKSIPVVLMSAAYDSIKLESSHPVAFLRKPFGLQDLFTAISSVIGEP
jgi:two-component system, OmpR family, alkaline phosphatase synthesis response regulator PhoP